jgi:crotonobetainyl-CoA:carnitine CoA-transferase CaiB-like acyl-CoA transferase
MQSALFEICAPLFAQQMQQYVMSWESPPPMPARRAAWSVYDVFALAGNQLFIGADAQMAALGRMSKFAPSVSRSSGDQ